MNRATWTAFRRDERGNFAVAFGIAVPMLALAAGYGIDVAQIYHTRSSLQNSLDAAVTSTARDLTTGKIKESDARERVETFLKANGNAGLAKGETATLGNLVVNRITKTVDADAYVDASMMFGVFGSGNRKRIGVNSAAIYSDKKIEVTMMLDVTGSMGKGKGQKIKDLKLAATHAVDSLLAGNNPYDPRIRVSIVPYAEAVNVGALADEAVFREETDAKVARGDAEYISVSGLLVDLVPKVVSVTLRLGAALGIVKSEPNLPPPAGATPRLVAALTGKRSDSCATERKLPDGSADFSDDGPDATRINKARLPYLARVNRDDRMRICPRPQVVPLTADPRKLNDSIDDFKADGWTAGAIALQWGYYMLSPEWSDTVRDAGLGDGAAAWNKKKTAKVAILMTDGQFNTTYAGGSLTSMDVHSQDDEARGHAGKLCDAMKAKGIEIFTIGFDLDDPDMTKQERADARKVLQDCASTDTSAIKHFYDATDGEELDRAFQEIVANTERLAVTK